MNYTRRAFFALMDKVERQGGRHLDETCDSQVYEFTGEKSKPHFIRSCETNSLFEVPYEVEPTGPELLLDTLKVCAVDDSMGAWPRFGGAIPTGDNVPHDSPTLDA